MIDELERRVRTVEEEVEGEKAVTRHVLQQNRLNANDLASLRTELRNGFEVLGTQVGQLTDDMVLVKAALGIHGRRLNALTQDVSELRNETTALRRDVSTVQQDFTTLRRDVGTIQQDLTTLRSEMNAKFDLVLDAIRAGGPRGE